MRINTFILGLMAAVLAAGWAVPAMATPVTFDISTYVGGGIPAVPPPYATVTLNQNGANVDVDLTLKSCCGFTSTGAGSALLFNLKESSITIGGTTLQGSDLGFVLNTANYALVGGSGTGPYTASSASIHTGGGGNFGYAIQCIGCGNGGSGLLLGPLDFTVDNVLVSDFISNGTAMFGTDICINRTGTTCTSGITGLAIDGGGTTTQTPEPVTTSLFGVGLVGLAVLRRRKKA